ncbi:MAG: argininosuccinate lyase [Eubacterium sp.]|nr:argininosuccinate lyase [Eubacterium sp.]
MSENGKDALKTTVDGVEVEASTAEEQLALFKLKQEQADAAKNEPKEPAKIIKEDKSKEAKEDLPNKKESSEGSSKSANLWGGRFTKGTEKKVYDFNASINFDKRLYPQDIMGSMAHASMLGKVGVLTKEESEDIVHALADISSEIEEGKLEITDEYEDIHSFVEAKLIERLGDTGKKVHTGRSRNDQVALDMRLFTREQVLEVDEKLLDLLDVIYGIMKENTETIMPGFTHLQKAQPTTLAHHMGAYFEMFKRDRGRMENIFNRMNYCPLGSGAFAGTTYPLDRQYTAETLGFYGPTLNSMDGVSDRDYLIEFLSALSMVMMHLSRFSEEVIIWNSNEYQFVEIDDAYSTGSSIMPQKKNPDIAELVRGKTGRVYGALMSLLTTMKGIPLAYNKDMQEDKEMAFDAMDTAKDCIELFADMLHTMKFNKDRMKNSASKGFTNATDAADYLVNHGVPFRDAHGIIGRLVLYGIEKGKAIDEMSLEELKSISDVFEEDIYDAISMETCVNKRLTVGAPGKEAMEGVLMQYENYLRQDWKSLVQ